jgi:cytochrome c-type biogenesis protein
MFDIALALLAGVATIAAPCTLPVLPVLLGASVGHNKSKRPAAIALGFVVSFSGVALVLGALTRIFDFDPDVLHSSAAVLLAGFGLLMIWPKPFEWLSIKAGGVFTSAKTTVHRDPGAISGFLLGTTLGLVWTPCAGPVLGSILTLVATSTDVRWASVLLVAYATGAAIPMLTVAYGGQAITARFRMLARHSLRLQQLFGVIVVAFAIASYFQYDTLILSRLTSLYPSGWIGL